MPCTASKPACIEVMSQALNLNDTSCGLHTTRMLPMGQAEINVPKSMYSTGSVLRPQILPETILDWIKNLVCRSL